MRLLFAIAALSLFAAGPANAADDQTAANRDCFISSNWHGWSAVDEGDALYLRVNVNDVYRVELTPGSHVRERAGRFLVSEVRGSNYICSAIDLDLQLADEFGFSRPLFPRSLRKLTAEEVAAIAPEDRP
jgi:hypothetical protein